MNINDLPKGSYKVVTPDISYGPPATGLQNDFSGKDYTYDNGKFSSFDQSQAALARSQAIMDGAFKTPLHSIAEGNAGAGVEHLKGALKQGASEFSMAGAQNAGPVGAAMMKNAPGFAQNIQSFKDLTTPTNIEQAKGAAETSIGEALIPADLGVQAASNSPLLAKVAKKTGLTDFLANRAEKKTVDTLRKALTPTELKPTEKLREVVKGNLKPARLFSKASIDPEMSKQIQNNVDSVMRASKDLGKSPTDIVKSGTGQGIKSTGRIDDLISEYSEKIAHPFVKNSGANYNFADLRKTFDLVKPRSGLNSESLTAYNRVRDELLSAVENKASPAVKDIRSLSELRTKSVGGEIPKKILKGDEDIWEARSLIDDIVQKETKGKAFGDKELQGAQAAYEDYRRAYAQYLSDAYRYPNQMENVNRANEFLKSPQGRSMDKTGWKIGDFEKQFGLNRNKSFDMTADKWDEIMKTLSNLYDTKTSLAPKAAKEYGKNLFQLFRKDHPVLSAGAGLAGLATLGTVIPNPVKAAIVGNE